MSLRQYQLAHRASAAWPRGAYRLVRIHSGDADAPAVFAVHNGTGEKLGRLTVSNSGVFYGGLASAELAEALAAVRRALGEDR